MKWLPALFIGAILGFALPLFFGGQAGVWMKSFASWGTMRPIANSPGLLFSIPVFLVSAVALRVIMNWHRN